VKEKTSALEREREKKLALCEQALGHAFRDRKLLALALTHSSLRDPWTHSNERLEFLGDSVLGLVVAEHLFRSHPDLQEGELTRLKSLTVSTEALIALGKKLGLGTYLRVGKGIRRGRAVPTSLIANTVEAVVGAMYLDAGFAAARERVLDWIGADLAALPARSKTLNFKAALQQSSQRIFARHPSYVVVDCTGPDHKKEFVVAARIGERDFPPAKGKTKKIAEQRAARLALRQLKKHGIDPPPARDSERAG